MKLEEVINLFLGTQRNQHTRRAYELTLRYMTAYIGAKRPVEKLSVEDLLGFAAFLDEMQRENDWQNATMYKHIKQTKSFFNWLVRIERLEKSPAAAIRQVRLSRSVDPDKAMTNEEYQAILDVAKYFPQKLAIIMFLGDTGCRAGGVAKLTISNLELHDKTAVVVEKGNKERPVWFGDDCAQTLQTWLQRRGERDHDYVFCHSNGPYTSDAISQIVRRCCKTAGIRSLGAHSIRHRFGFNAANSGVRAAVVQRILGHESIETTMKHYYRLDETQMKEAVRKLATNTRRKPDNIIKLKSS